MADVHVRLFGFSRIDFNKNVIRKALRLEAKPIWTAARAKVAKKTSRKQPSAPGTAPGRRTGLLRRSIGVKVLNGGFAVTVGPRREVLEAKRGKEDAAYPWFLLHGVRHGASHYKLKRRDRAAAKAARVSQGFKVEPRSYDYMREALRARRDAATQAIRLALETAMIPRKL